MKRMLYRWATLTLLVVWVSLAFAQAPTAVIKVKGYSPQDIINLKWTSPRSTGLPNVGVKQVVYLVDTLGNVAGRTYAWSLTAKPTGSTAALDSVDKWQTTFKPDVPGRFTVQLVITASGSTSNPSTITINAAKYVGVGGMDGLPVDFAAGQCALCHSGVFNLWNKTGHAMLFKEGIDGIASDHYAESCIQCHTTGYDGDPNTGNDGFDDVQKEVGWKFPAKLHAGNYDTLKTFYPKLAHRANIQCESCHGPGSLHKGSPAGIAMSIDPSVCAYCHDRGTNHIHVEQWKASRHAVLSAEANNASCARCHSGWGFIRRADPIASVQPDPRPTMGFGRISCAVCHDQHRVDLPHQVRSLADVTLGDSTTVVKYGGQGKVCMQCHIGRRPAVLYTETASNLSTRFGPHHSNQADMLDGSNAIDYGIPIGSSGHKFAVENTCVTCHMAATPAAGQPGNNKVGEHTFAIKWDNGTPDNPADDVENVTACQTCHGPIKSFDDIMAKADYDEDGTIEGTRQEVEGLVERLDKVLPSRTLNGVLDNNVIKANYNWTLPGLTPEQIAQRKAYTKAWFNLMFVTEDGSMGVHNAGFAIALLRRSIASITTGDIGAGDIISITDVPNDQGKQVRLAWSKAPGDGLSTNPVTGYSVWRRVDQSAGAAANAVASKDDMLRLISKDKVGSRFTIAQAGTWDFVAWIPSSGYEFYSMVVPTIYDSTAQGMHWSVFFVAGHARSQIYESAPDSGYSIDNLAPFAPSNFALSVLANKVNLRWADPIDEDFQYFAVYRGTTADIDPKVTKPLATLIGTNFTDNDVKTGDKYYYTVTAFDFAGNQSNHPQPLLASITSVAENGGGAPTEYALQQNYPNPFNPETTIKYQLPGTSHVRLSIYTALGQEIRLLVDYSQPAAYHQVVWDGRDNAGNLMPSGVYFYRLETDKFTAIKKMVMMK